MLEDRLMLNMPYPYDTRSGHQLLFNLYGSTRDCLPAECAKHM